MIGRAVLFQVLGISLQAISAQNASLQYCSPLHNRYLLPCGMTVLYIAPNALALTDLSGNGINASLTAAPVFGPTGLTLATTQYGETAANALLPVNGAWSVIESAAFTGSSGTAWSLADPLTTVNYQALNVLNATTLQALSRNSTAQNSSATSTITSGAWATISDSGDGSTFRGRNLTLASPVSSEVQQPAIATPVRLGIGVLARSSDSAIVGNLVFGGIAVYPVTLTRVDEWVAGNAMRYQLSLASGGALTIK